MGPSGVEVGKGAPVVKQAVKTLVKPVPPAMDPLLALDRYSLPPLPPVRPALLCAREKERERASERASEKERERARE